MNSALPILPAVLQTYARTDAVPAAPGADAAAPDFAGLVGRALEGAIASGHRADAQATQAVEGHGDLTEVVTAVSRAELALQTTVSIRDRVIQAYQDIIKMPI